MALNNVLPRIITVPGDKSISHRAVIFASISDRVSMMQNLCLGNDVLRTISAMEAMGVKIIRHQKNICIHGVGRYGLTAPQQPIDCGNSGTTMRLLTGLLCAQPFDSVLIGDHSLSKRPMARVADPLRRMGADIRLSPNNTAPIYIIGHKKLHGMEYELTIPSAQVKSAILLAGLYAKGETRVKEKIQARDHTERLLASFPQEYTIPGDISAAAFFIVYATITPGAAIIIRDVGVNPHRTGIITLLKLMGADITLKNQRWFGHEPVADIIARHSSLKGITVPKNCIVSAIDEFPVFFIAAAMAKGKTILHHAEELRVKESDRIQVMCNNLQKLGVPTTEYSDGLMIHGVRAFQSAVVDAHQDHRVAMALHIAAKSSKKNITIVNDEAIRTSFPAFEKCL